MTGYRGGARWMAPLDFNYIRQLTPNSDERFVIRYIEPL
jgi:hypothetical protein